MAAFKTYILHYYNFDICSCCFRTFNFCYDCWTCVSGKRKPMFNLSNKIPQLYCQYYLAFLQDLASVDKTVIAKTDLVITILKLRPNNSFNLQIYRIFVNILCFCPKIQRHYLLYYYQKQLLWTTLYASYK